jgi:HAD superfamily hydrolase (TIGR01509 family)
MPRDQTAIQAYAFDLDGTLIDSEILWVEATHSYLSERGCALSHAAAVELVYGRSCLDIYADLARRFPLDMAEQALDVELRERVARLRASRDLVIPGSVALLRRLAKSYPVCVVSGSTRHDVAIGLDLAGVRDDVAFFLGAEDYAPGKPDPACYRAAADRLGVPPAACLVFEDSRAGVCAARAAGMRVVALARPGLPPQDFSAADRVVTDLGELEPLPWCGQASG